jgi:hypothetical protein
MNPPGTLPPRSPAAVLAEWRRLERLEGAGLVDESDRATEARRIEELKAEYRVATGEGRENHSHRASD